MNPVKAGADFLPACGYENISIQVKDGSHCSEKSRVALEEFSKLTDVDKVRKFHRSLYNAFENALKNKFSQRCRHPGEPI
jgi:hypothetical protein